MDMNMEYEDPYITAAKRRVEEQQQAAMTTGVPLLSPTPTSTPTSPAGTEFVFHPGVTRSRSEFEAADDFPGFSVSGNHQAFTQDRAQELLNTRNLTPESIAEVQEFMRGTDAVESIFRVLLVVLQNQDMLRRTAQDYSYLLLLLPLVYAYKHEQLGQKVLDIMRELKIADLPPAHDTGRCKVVTAECGSAFTQCRHGIKDKIAASLKSKIDIATLTRQIIQGTKARPTLALYIRFAMLRHVYTETESTKQLQEAAVAAGETPPTNTKKKGRKYESALDDFWGLVDKKLEFYRTQVPDAATRFEVYNGIYKKDCELYPRAASMEADLTVREKDVEPWLQTLQARAQIALSQ
ncbi:hypothetical protein C8R41DRAFT_872069 [Lentinula lateritia]|uniref:Uncharacterized protein n=1 Tax=Lentinula lateritia TaxID=40482 RepID=A0ABQ8UX98_9AGAR|nr:hypothetical protein C8R41DRAFT_872069 [Lentinula lateritia]